MSVWWWPFRSRPSFGRRAEIATCFHLRRKGFLLLASPFEASRGEIDIVARDGEMLVFVEVKARRRDDHPEDAVTPAKERRIVSAAREFRATHPRHRSRPYRFDIVAVTYPDGRKPSFHHYVDAFRARDAECVRRDS